VRVASNLNCSSVLFTSKKYSLHENSEWQQQFDEPSTYSAKQRCFFCAKERLTNPILPPRRKKYSFLGPEGRGGPRARRLGRLPPLKPTKVTSFTMILYNSENNIRKIKAFLPSIVLSQQCCEVHVISLTVAKPL